MSYYAVFGGTFNPFHMGHYKILESLCCKDFIDKVFLIPDRIPPHKEFNAEISDFDRIQMCKLMAEKFKKAEIKLYEFEREGKSYTFDTVTFLKNKYPNDKFAIVCGGDMLKTLDKWYRFSELKELVSFIVFNRSNDKNFKEDIKRIESFGATITVFDDIIPDVSSTVLRKQIKREFLPPEIYDYIIKKELYNDSKN